MTRSILWNMSVIIHTERYPWRGNNYNCPFLCIEWLDFVGHQQKEHSASWVITLSVLLSFAFFNVWSEVKFRA